jgi:hypothetical protein
VVLKVIAALTWLLPNCLAKRADAERNGSTIVGVLWYAKKATYCSDEAGREAFADNGPIDVVCTLAPSSDAFDRKKIHGGRYHGCSNH